MRRVQYRLVKSAGFSFAVRGD